jgi:hypothetical protein
MIVGGMTMSRGFITSAQSASDGLKQLQLNNQEIANTKLDVVGGNFLEDGSIEVIIKNTGQTKLGDFSRWDVIAEYKDDTEQTNVKWMPYTVSTPVDNQWSVSGIFIRADLEISEQFDPAILDPSEEISLRAVLSPPVGPANAVRLIISTPNGIQVSTIIVRTS